MRKRYSGQLLLGFVLLASIRLLGASEADRVQSLAQKVKCDCGCGEVLGECSHRECTRRPKLKQEITDAVLYGRNDDQILQQFAAAYGTAVLVTPRFQGFDMMLWGVPIAAAILVVAIVLLKFRRTKPETPS